ncbi:hypothetical protein V8C86DRAFT_2490168 [Haematococcus lacustris]
MGEAAQQLQQRTGCGAVLIKGGHLGPGADQDPQLQGQDEGSGGEGGGCVTDVLYDGRELHLLHAPRVLTANCHGTVEWGGAR